MLSSISYWLYKLYNYSDLFLENVPKFYLIKKPHKSLEIIKYSFCDILKKKNVPEYLIF